LVETRDVGELKSSIKDVSHRIPFPEKDDVPHFPICQTGRFNGLYVGPGYQL
jgi:hypothetical protein